MHLEPGQKEKKFHQFRKTVDAIHSRIETQNHLEAIKLYLRLKHLSGELKKFSTLRGIVFLENEVKDINEKLKEVNAHHSLRTTVDPSRIFPAAVVFILIIAGALLIRHAGITGLVTAHEEISYTDGLNLQFTSNTSYSWFLANAGDLKSAKVSGSLSAGSAARIYLKKGNQLKLIYDSNQTEEGNLGGITGAVAGNEGKSKGKDKKNDDETDEEEVANDTPTNETEQAQANETANNETSQTGSNETTGDEAAQNETNQINETAINETGAAADESSPAAEKTITINLAYNTGTAFDPDDNGMETTAGAIDFTVAGSSFNFGVDESLLCTKWQTYNLDNFESITTCNGNEDCCAFAGVLASSDNWNDTFYSSYGRYGAGLENVVYAQLVSYNVSLEPESPYVDIIISNTTYLNANYQYAYTYFNEECIETCSLNGYNEPFYELVIEVDGTLNLDSITYSILEAITKVNINLNVEDSSGPISSVLNIYSPNGSLVSGNQVEPDIYTIEAIPSSKIIEKVTFYGVNITKTLAGSIGIDNVSSAKANISNVDISRAFALDPSKLNFSSATLTGVASASALYKCKEWVFADENCLGSWEKIADLAVGEEYNITITPDDPGFAEGDLIENISEDITEELNVTFDASIKDADNNEINTTIQFIDSLTDILEEESKDKKKHTLKIKKDNYKIKVKLKDMPIEEIEIEDVNIYSNITEFINIDDVPNNISGPYAWTEVFAVDPTKINFSSAVVRRNATGTALYKCADWSFNLRECAGSWSFVRNLAINQSYNLTITPSDPGFGEAIPPGLAKKLVIKAKKFSYKSVEEPLFYIDITDANDIVIDENITAAFLKKPDKSIVDISNKINKIGAGSFSIAINFNRSFAPGLYEIEARSGEFTVINQNFTWGVLAINTHKSVYLPNELAEIGIAVLDNEGHMVCDADVELEITDALGVKTTLTTPNEIVVTEACYVYDINKRADYAADYTVNSAGTYSINLTAVTSAGTWSIEDNFTVASSVDFDVSRPIEQTRIYPFVNYTMDITIIANQNYNGLVNEYVPASFEITPQAGLAINTVGSTKVLSWDVKLKKNDVVNLAYEYDAPDVSPEFYLLGKLDIGTFSEARYWQIASDAIGVQHNWAWGLDLTTSSTMGRRSNTGDDVPISIKAGSTRGSDTDPILRLQVVNTAAITSGERLGLYFTDCTGGVLKTCAGRAIGTDPATQFVTVEKQNGTTTSLFRFREASHASVIGGNQHSGVVGLTEHNPPAGAWAEGNTTANYSVATFSGASYNAHDFSFEYYGSAPSVRKTYVFAATYNEVKPSWSGMHDQTGVILDVLPSPWNGSAITDHGVSITGNTTATATHIFTDDNNTNSNTTFLYSANESGTYTIPSGCNQLTNGYNTHTLQDGTLAHKRTCNITGLAPNAIYFIMMMHNDTNGIAGNAVEIEGPFYTNQTKAAVHMHADTKDSNDTTTDDAGDLKEDDAGSLVTALETGDGQYTLLRAKQMQIDSWTQQIPANATIDSVELRYQWAMNNVPETAQGLYRADPGAEPSMCNGTGGTNWTLVETLPNSVSDWIAERATTISGYTIAQLETLDLCLNNTNKGGAATSDVVAFDFISIVPVYTPTTSGSGAPNATTEAATLIGETQAQLNAIINTQGISGKAYFEYGLDTSYGSYSPDSSGEYVYNTISMHGVEQIAYYRTVSGLTLGTTYSYRACLKSPPNSTATCGANQTFTTSLSTDYSVNLTINGLKNQDVAVNYPTRSNANGTCGDGAGTCFLHRNNSNGGAGTTVVSSDTSSPFLVGENITLAAGYNYNYTINNTNNATGRSYILNVSKAAGNSTLNIFPSSPLTYGTQIQANCTSTDLDSGGKAILYRNGTDVTSSENGTFVTLAAGNHNYNCTNAANNGNYTFKNTSYIYTVSKAAGNANLFINGSEADLVQNITFDVRLSCNVTSGNATLYEDSVKVISNYSLVNYSKTYASAGNFNWTCRIEDVSNHTAETMHWVNATEAVNLYCNNALNSSANKNFRISTNIVCSNVNILLGENSNITVLAGGNLTLMNGTNLTFKMTADGNSFLNKSQNGGLWITNSTITSDNSAYEYDFWAYGTGANDNFTLQNSIVRYAGYSTKSLGIQLYNVSNVIINGNNVSEGAYYGLYLQYSANNNISSNTITTSGSNGYGIYLLSSSNSSISSNTITTNGTSGRGISLVTSSNSNIVQSNIITTNGSSGYGIFLSSISSSNITSNTMTTSGSNGYGIYLFSSSNSSISSNTITTNGSTGRGIFLSSSSNSSISSNTITTTRSSGYGILLDTSSNSNTLQSNTITTNGSSGYGIYLYTSSSNNATGNNITATGANSDGFYIDGSSATTLSDNNTIQNNNITNSGRHGIYIVDYAANNIIYSNRILDSGSGANNYSIFIQDATAGTTNSNNISFNFINNSIDDGIYIASDFNKIDNNNITFSGGDGITIASGGINNNITLNLIANSSSHGILVLEDNNSFIDNKIYNSTKCGLNASSAIGINATNNSFTDNVGNDFCLATNSLVWSINNSFTKSKLSFDGSAANNLTVAWYVHVNTTNSSRNTPIISAAVTAYANITGSWLQEWASTTNGSGLSPGLVTIQFIQNDTNVFAANYTPHNFTATKTGYNSNSTISTIDRSKTVIVSMEEIPVTGYCTNSNITSQDGKKFEISTNIVCNNVNILLGQNSNITVLAGGNLTLMNGTNLTFKMTADGNSFLNKSQNGGLWITNSTITSDNSAYEYDFWAYGTGANDNFTLQNSIVRDAGYSTAGTSRGIQLYNVSNVVVSGNNVSDGANYGLYLLYSTNNNISSNTINTTATSGYGIFLSTSSNSNTIQSNIINTTGSNGYGIYLYSSSTNNISSNTITTNGTSGYGTFLFDNSNSNTLQSNTITTTGSSGYGIRFDTGLNSNTLQSNTITTTGSSGYGIYLSDNSNSNTLQSNTITTTGSSGYGIYLSASLNNNATGNNITAKGANSDGFYIDGTSSTALSDNNTIQNNNITNSNRHGIYMQDYAANNIIYNNRILDSGSGANNYSIFIQDATAGTTNSNNISFNFINNSIDDGIYIASDFNKIDSNNITFSSGDGITIANGSVRNNITLNIVINSTKSGILILESNNTIYSNQLYNSTVGINITNALNTNITLNIVKDSRKDGILLTSSNSTVIDSNNISFNLDDCIELSPSSILNNITNNLVENCTGYGVYIQSANNLLRDNTIRLSKKENVFITSAHNTTFERDLITNASVGLNVSKSSNINLTNVSFRDNTRWDIVVDLNSSVTLLNSSFNKSKVNISASYQPPTTAPNYANFSQYFNDSNSTGNALYSAGLFDISQDSLENDVVFGGTGAVSAFDNTGRKRWEYKIISKESSSYNFSKFTQYFNSSNSTQNALYSAGIFDYEQNGRRDDVIFGGVGKVSAFDSEGKNIWNWTGGSTIIGEIYDIEVFDRGTGFNDTIAVIDNEGSANGSLIILDKDGNKLCNTSDLGTAYAAAIGDFNEDGNKSEIVVGTNENISAFYSNCTQMWTATDPTAVTREVETGDLDNDGYYDDIAVVDNHPTASDYLMVYNGSGVQQWNLTLVVDFFSVEIGNIDDVAGSDIIISGDGRVNAYNSSGSSLWNFVPPTGDIYEIRFGNFSNNGIIAFVDPALALLFVLNASGSQSWNSSVLNNSGLSAAVGDLDNDGLDDIVVAGSNNTVLMFNNSGSNLWNYTVGDDIGSAFADGALEIADIDGDGKNDVIAASQDNYGYVLYANRTTTQSTGLVYDIEVFDRGNGYNNTIAVIDSVGSAEGSLLLLDRYGNKICNSSDLGTAYASAIGDLNMDGNKSEIVVGGDNGTYAAVWAYYSNCTEIWRNITTDKDGNGNPYRTYEVEIGDLDSDSYYDDVAMFEYGGSFDLISNLRIFNGSGSQQWNMSFPGALYSGEIGNIDGVAGEDIIVGAGAQVNAYNGSSYNLWNFTNPTGAISEIRFGNFSNNGIIAFVDTGLDVLFVLNASGNQSWNASVGADITFSLAVGDLDNDNKNDIVVGGTADKVLMFNNSGSNLWNYTVGGDIGDSSIGVADGALEIADIDGDGKKDVIAASVDNYGYVLKAQNTTTQVDDKSNLTVKWYLNVNTKDSSSNNIQSADVNVSQNTSGSWKQVFTGATDSSGLTGWFTVTEYIQNATGITNFTHNISGNKTGYDYNSSIQHISSSLTFTLTLPSHTTICGETIAEDTNLSSNITGNNCLTIKGGSIYLDCKNYLVTGAGAGTGVTVVNVTDIEIRNCIIQNFSNAVLFSSSNNSRLTNSTLRNNSVGLNATTSLVINITNSSIINSTAWDLFVNENSSVIALNSSFNKSKVNVSASYQAAATVYNYSNFVQYFNDSNSTGTALYSAGIADLNADNTKNDVIFGGTGAVSAFKGSSIYWKYNINSYSDYINNTFVQFWNSSNTTTALYSAGMFDTNGNGKEDSIVFGGVGNVSAYNSRGYNIWNWTGGSGIIYDIEVFDRGTGFNDTIAIIDDEGSANGSLIILDKDGNKLCNTSDLGTAYAAAIGDFNEDGNRREIVVGLIGNVSAFYSNCTQMWISPLPSATYPGYGIETGDLDNDGYYDDVADVIGSSTGDGFLSIFNGSGASIYNTSTINMPRDIEIGNIDDKGGEDIIIGISGQVNAYNGSGSNLWNNTDPTDFIYEIRFGNFSNNGIMAFVDRGTDYLFVLNASGQQSWNASLTAAVGWLSLAVGDLDNDGKDDIVVGDDTSNVVIMLNNSGSKLWNYTVGNDIGSTYADGALEIADIDGDGRKDVIVASLDKYGYVLRANRTTTQSTGLVYDIEVFDRGNGYNNTIAVIDGVGSAEGSLLLLDRYGNKICNSSDLGTAYAAAIGDFNEDGNKSEVVVGTNGNVSVFYSNCTQIWVSALFSSTSTPEDVKTGDLDGDNYYGDVAVGVTVSTGTAYLQTFNNSGDSLWNSSNLNNNFDSLAVANIDGKTGDDIVATTSNSKKLFFFNSSGSNIWNYSWGFGVAYQIRISNISNDNNIIFAVGGTGATSTLYVLNSTGSQTWNSTITSTTESYESLAVGDLDNDGKDDIVVGGTANKVLMFNNSGYNLWNYTVGGDIGSIYADGSLEIADIDGDGKNDVIAASQDMFGYVLKAQNTTTAENLDKSNLTVKWYLAVNVTGTSYNAISGAAVTAYENSTASWRSEWNATTAANGLTGSFITTEYIQNATNILYYTPHNISGNKTANYKDNSTIETINRSRIILLKLPSLAPVITLLRPADNSWINRTINITFYYNVTSVNALANCSLVIDNSINVTNTTAVSTAYESNLSTNLTDKATGYYWTVNCTDGNGNTGTATAWLIKVDSTQPVIALGPPSNNSWVNDQTINLNYTLTDASEGTCQLYGNFNGTWLLNKTDADAQINSNNNFTINLTQGNYIWNVWCNDSAANEAWNLTNFTINIDRTAPGISLAVPNNNAVQNSSAIQFNWTATDYFGKDIKCNLTINGTVNQSNIAAINASTTNITVSGFKNAIYLWNTTCWDNATNTNTSATWNFTVSISVAELKINDTSTNITINGNLNQDVTITYLTRSNVNGTCGDNSSTCFLHRNSTLVSSDTAAPFLVGENITLAAGSYNYTVNNTFNKTGQSYILTVNKAVGDANLFINGTEADLVQNITFKANITCNVSSAITDGNATLYEDGSKLLSNLTKVTLVRTYSTKGNRNVSCDLEAENYTATTFHWINATKAPGTYCSGAYSATDTNWVISTDVECKDEIIPVDGNITISANGNLTLYNTTINFTAMASDGSQFINKTATGALQIYNNSLIQAYNSTGFSAGKYDFWSYGVGSYDNFTIQNSKITDAGYSTAGTSRGIQLYNISNAVISGNNISNGARYGLYLQYSANNSIINNSINTTEGSGWGIFINSSSNSTIKSNIITTTGNAGYGIYLITSSNSTIKSNNITTNGTFGYGVFLDANSNSNILTSNTITTNGSSGRGILLGTSSSSNISGNTITTGNTDGYGIFLDAGSSSNTLTSNTITTERLNGYGIYLASNSSLNTIQNSTITTNGVTGYGILINSSSNSTLQNNTITTSNSNAYGVYLLLSSNSTIKSNTIATIGDAARGIFFSVASNWNTVQNNTITTSGVGGLGIYVFSSSNSTIQSNTITTNGTSGHGIFLDSGSISNSLISNTITANGSLGRGIHLKTSSNSNITGNIIATNGTSGHGIYLWSNSNSNTMQNNTITTVNTNSYGIYLNVTSNANILQSNTIATNGSSANGVYLLTSFNNNATANIINATGTNADGIYIFADSDNNRFSLNNITRAGRDGIRIAPAGTNQPTGNIIQNNIITNSSANGILVLEDNNSVISNQIYNSTICGLNASSAIGINATNNSFTDNIGNDFCIAANSLVWSINNSFTKSKVLFDGANNNNLTVAWYAHVNTTTASRNAPVTSASVIAYENRTGSWIQEWAADSGSADGMTAGFITIQFIQSNTNVFAANYTPHNFSASKTGYNSNSTISSISSSKIVIVTLEETAGADQTAPAWKNNQTNISVATKTQWDAWFSINFTDGTALNYSIFSFDDGTGTFVNDTPVSLDANKSAAVNVTKTITATRGKTVRWKWYVNDTSNNINETDTWSIVVNNTLPTQVNLSAPVNGTTTLQNRTPTFNWTKALDNDSDNITYQIVITCLAADCGGYADKINVTGIAGNNYTITNELAVDTQYNWTVRANDSTGYGEWSGIFNFSVQSIVSISLLNATVNFGDKSIGDKDNTTDNSPNPLVIVNDGTVTASVVNISILDELWDRSSAQTPSDYFQFQAGNSSEAYSFNWSGSQTGWAQVALINKSVIDKLNYSDASDTAEIEIHIEVPGDEPAGRKTTSMVIYGMESS